MVHLKKPNRYIKLYESNLCPSIEVKSFLRRKQIGDTATGKSIYRKYISIHSSTDPTNSRILDPNRASSLGVWGEVIL
jgi:hypothetical protein